MATKIKYALYVLAASLLFVPLVFMSGAEAVTCYEISGTSNWAENTGSLTPSEINPPCMTADGAVSGVLISDEIGPIFLDHGYAAYDEVSIDLETGAWSGYGYAPLDAYAPFSAGGAFFNFSPVRTDLANGLISAAAWSPNLGNLSMGGMSMELPPVTLTVDVDYEVLNGDRDGYAIADGESYYNLTVSITSSDQSLSVYGFGLTTDLTESGEMCFDQVTGGCENLEAISHGGSVVYSGEDLSGTTEYYSLAIYSHAPTSDVLCYEKGASEYCFEPGSENYYYLDELDLNIVMDRDYILEYQGSELADATLTLGDSLSFIAPYELVGLYPVGGAEEMGLVTLVQQGEIYSFSPSLKKYGADATPGHVYVYYSVDDEDFEFGYAEGEQTDFDVAFAGEGNLGGEDAFSAISVWSADESASLDEGATASVIAYIEATVDGDSVLYPSQYFFFADIMAGIAEPRLGVVGTVSGLAEGDDLTVVGNVSKMELRDVVYEQVMKTIRSVNNSTIGGGTVYDSWDASIEAQELLDESVLYFVGDGDVVTIEGGDLDGNVKTILGVGVDVYIESSIDGEGELGIIVLENEDGDGGNMYVDKSVVDLYANIFLDGTFYRGTDAGAYPDYDSAGLTSQLYLKGSLISENTIGGYGNGICGDGEECADGDAQKEDLEYMSNYQVCYAYSVVDGVVAVDIDTYEECDGYTPSTNYTGSYEYSPVVIEYNPPSESLPIFSVAGNLVR